MSKKFAAATALAGSLLLVPLMQGSAQSASVPSLNSPHSGVTLVGHGGGGGGHMGGGGPGAMAHTGGMGGGVHGGAMIHNGGMGGPHFAGGPHGNHFAHSDGDRVVSRQDHSHRRFAERDFDHGSDFDHGHRHRVFRNGVWVWTYGPGYYAYDDDCWWLLRRARITGSGYWWSRYSACVGYY